MRRFSYCVMIAFLWLAALPAAQAAICSQPARPPSIRIEVQAIQPVVDHSRSRFELKNFDIATISPYGNESNVHVNGLMRGAITVETQMALAWQRAADGGDNCFWFDNVHVNLRLNPTIYIAREIDESSCLYNEVLKHEYKHYDVDYTTAQDYQLVFQDTLERFIHQTGVLGPFPAEFQEQPKQELSQRLEHTIRAINERLKTERVNRQSLIDTRVEYERVSHACPGEAGMM